MIKGNLLHLGFNMWADRVVTERWADHVTAQPDLRFEESLWDDLLERMVGAGLNMVVIDLGDAVKYESHPEIAVKGAWTPKKLRAELKKLRTMGLEPIPKLNFSTAHDAWLGPYARMVSTDRYYGVCKDLIAEVVDLFDKPRLFHLGMDEETSGHQKHYLYLVVRQYDLWWHDFLFLVDQVEKAGARAWIWSDYVWNHPDLFFERMPKSVLQSNWYYGKEFNDQVNYVKAYRDLEEHGYDQVPTGSNWSCVENTQGTIDWCRKVIAPERFKGYLQTSWKPTLEVERARHEQAIDLAGKALASLR